LRFLRGVRSGVGLGLQVVGDLLELADGVGNLLGVGKDVSDVVGDLLDDGNDVMLEDIGVGVRLSLSLVNWFDWLSSLPSLRR
jgi:hypothetical protein